jgi:hypothetical protein
VEKTCHSPITSCKNVIALFKKTQGKFDKQCSDYNARNCGKLKIIGIMQRFNPGDEWLVVLHT